MSAVKESAAKQGRRMRGNLLLWSGGILAALVTIVAIIAPFIVPFPQDAANATNPSAALLPPSAEHLFGTDQFGRDLFSRVLMGAQVSLPTAVVILIVAIGIGVPIGLLAGYFGGFLDDLLMRTTDVFLALPGLLLALALATVLPPGSASVAIAVGISWWPWYARLARGQAASVRERRFVESARFAGVSHRRILGRHVLPHTVTPVIVQASLDIGHVILVIAGLSYLGIGPQDPVPDWGLMVSSGQKYFMTNWWLVTFPGVAILVAAASFNLLGDGLRDYLDPKKARAR